MKEKLKSQKHKIIFEPKKNKIVFKKNKIILYHIIIFIITSIIIPSISVVDPNDLDESRYSYITLKIGKGNNYNVYSNSYSNKPKIVYINEIKQSTLGPKFNLDKQENNVILIWEKYVTNCQNMFKYCNQITELNFTHFDTSQVEQMTFMFQGCTNLKNLDVSNMDTSKVQNMGVMFSGCSSLTSLNLSHFNTQSVTNIGTMFKDCSSLISLDLSNFDTSNNRNLDNLFNGCTSLTYVDLSSFDTFQTRQMQNMFLNCKSLKSINISHFNTHNVGNFQYLFKGCESLISLDFQNMDLSSASTINNMFDNCKSLEYVNIKNYKINDNSKNYDFFKDCPKNIAICTENTALKNKIKDDCSTIDCSDNWYELRNKINNNQCVENCTLTANKYEYNFQCHSNCPEGTYNNNYKCEDCHEDCENCIGPKTTTSTNCISCLSKDKYLYFGNCMNECPRNSYYHNDTIVQNICDCELTQCKTCSKESLNKNLCTVCNTDEDYFPINDEYNNILPFYNCTKELEGYYFDRESFTYKLCFSTCEKCDKGGNEKEHNCLECKYNFNFEIHFGIYKNCYENCSYYHYFDENENISYCTNISECAGIYNKLLEDKKECVSACTKDNEYKYEFRKKCHRECPSDSTKEENYFCKPICNKDKPYEIVKTQECVEKCDYKEIKDKSCILNYKNPIKEDTEKIYDDLLKNIEDDFTSDNYNTSNLENGNDDIIVLAQMTITFTTTENQKDEGKNINVTTIDLKDCEKILKDEYHIPETELLYMKKIDVIEEGMKIPKIQYEVYTKYNRTNLLKLNLSYCSNTQIDISIPTKLTESLDKLNLSSEYYNDICYTATSDSGTDITLSDRKDEFINNNKTVCQEKCIFAEYDDTTQKAKCVCDVVEASSTFSNSKIDKSELYKNFIDIKNMVNVKILLCYKKLFCKEGILKNYGSYSLMGIIFLHLLIILIFYASNSLKKIKDVIKEISFGKKIYNYFK